MSRRAPRTDTGERLGASVLPVGLRPGGPGAEGRGIHQRLVAGVEELLAAADGVVALADQTVGACPNFGSGRQDQLGVIASTGTPELRVTT